VLLAALAEGQTLTVLYNFTGASDGSLPYAGIIQDAAGKLYGTAFAGGSDGGGVVYEVNTAGTERVLYAFCSQTSCADGSSSVAPLVRDKAGNLYGNTDYGGSTLYSFGTVFKIDTAGKETVLYSFTGGTDGCYPGQGLIRDGAGNLYGTTNNCGSGSAGLGNIFEVERAGNLILLHDFAGGSSDGANPAYGHLTMDKAGNLYGVTPLGGGNNNGVLYKLSKNGALTVLHSFGGGTSDGCNPQGSVVQDKSGNFYGTAGGCGTNNYGTIWKLSKTGKETILHNFAGGTADGCYTVAGVTRDSKGNLYGVTLSCGAYNYGALYKLSPSGMLTLLHSFDNSDGNLPYGELLRTAKGTLLGTASMGGTYGYGTVWKYVP
jgi:uncharacterized repeat protein (TIGR03803 family)